MQLLDRRAVLAGALVAAAVFVPLSILGNAVVDDDADSNLVFLILVPIALGYGLGGVVAASRARSAPLANGAVAAVAGYVAVAGVAVALRVAQGEAIEPAAIAFAAVLAYASGLLGGLAVDRLRRRRPADANPAG